MSARATDAIRTFLRLNYFNYFTEIETRFQERRGTLLMLSTLDWALIETWREAGIPLAAALRGIDAAFDQHDAQQVRARGRRQRKVNGLAWCAQAVMEAMEQAREASVGSAEARGEVRDSGFDPERIARYLRGNSSLLQRAAQTLPAAGTAREAAARLDELASELTGDGGAAQNAVSLEELERTLSVLEEKIVASLVAGTPEAELAELRAQAERELAPYRSRMQAHQIRQVQQQFLQKRLLAMHGLPRLSLFYMAHE